MKQSKLLTLLGILLVVGGTLVCVVSLGITKSWLHHKFIDDFEYALGTEFPDGTSQADFYDNLEYYMVMYAILPDCGYDFLQTFASVRHESTFNIEWFKSWFSSSQLQRQNRSIPDGVNFAYKQGKGTDRTWYMVLDRDTGRIWILVFYPDHAGDLYGSEGH